VIDPQLRKDQVTDKLAATQVMTEVMQINAQRIVTDSLQAAEKLKDRIDKGEDFTKVANEQSQDEIDNVKSGVIPKGGNLGWFAKEGSTTVTDADFAAKALELTEKAGEVSKPFQVGEKWYIVKVLERDDKRPREQSQIDTLRQKAYDDWFKKAKDSMSSRITTKLPSLPSVPTVPAIQEPTSAPVQQTPIGPQGPPGPTTTITGTNGVTNTMPLTNTNSDTGVSTPTVPPNSR